MSEYKDGLALLFMYLRVINLRVTLFNQNYRKIKIMFTDFKIELLVLKRH